jgi:hypothetical protein
MKIGQNCMLLKINNKGNKEYNKRIEVGLKSTSMLRKSVFEEVPQTLWMRATGALQKSTYGKALASVQQLYLLTVRLSSPFPVATCPSSFLVQHLLQNWDLGRMRNFFRKYLHLNKGQNFFLTKGRNSL